MIVLIIGLGSIAQKHILALKSIDAGVVIFALRSGKIGIDIHGVINLYSWDDIPGNIDFIIISNPTIEHFATIEKAISLNKPLFIEKPPLASLQGAEQLWNKIKEKNIPNFVAFSLRFHPVIQWLKKEVNVQKVLEVNAYYGSYLPEWRPGTDYRNSYSSRKASGGGVHLDLIHEIDYVTWIFGTPRKLDGFISTVSTLELDVPDCAHYWLQYDTMNASVTVNYYRRHKKREVEIAFEDETWIADLMNYTVKNGNGQIIYKTDTDIMIPYKAQMNYFVDTLQHNIGALNDFGNSLNTLALCLSAVE